MKKVLEQAKVLAETIVESEVFQKMHNAELALNQNIDANIAIMKVMEKRSAVEGMLASNDMDNVALAAAARELEEAEKAMNEIPVIAELQANRQAFSEMMEGVNRILRVVITGEPEEEGCGGCSGSCEGCSGCHH